jgi:hypothetical protein
VPQEALKYAWPHRGVHSKPPYVALAAQNRDLVPAAPYSVSSCSPSLYHGIPGSAAYGHVHLSRSVAFPRPGDHQVAVSRRGEQPAGFTASADREHHTTGEPKRNAMVGTSRLTLSGRLRRASPPIAAPARYHRTYSHNHDHQHQHPAAVAAASTSRPHAASPPLVQSQVAMMSASSRLGSWQHSPPATYLPSAPPVAAQAPPAAAYAVPVDVPNPPIAVYAPPVSAYAPQTHPPRSGDIIAATMARPMHRAEHLV